MEVKKEEKHVVCFSGGKDSTYMLLWLLEHGYPVDDIVYCEVMVNELFSGDFPEMSSYIAKVEQYIERKITRIRGEKTFEDIFYQKIQKGFKEGVIYGFPYTLGAWCNSRLKVSVLDKYFRNIGPHVRYIGIAADEPIRYARLAKNCRAPLYEAGITETECRSRLAAIDLLNPLYEKFKRLGCWFCPKQGLDSLRVIYREYPDYWQQLLKWDKDSPGLFKPSYSVQMLDERFCKES